MRLNLPAGPCSCLEFNHFLHDNFIQLEKRRCSFWPWTAPVPISPNLLVKSFRLIKGYSVDTRENSRSGEGFQVWAVKINHMLSNLGRLAGYQSSCPTSVSLWDSFSMNPLRCNNVAFPSFFSAFTLDEACDWCSLVMWSVFTAEMFRGL